MIQLILHLTGDYVTQSDWMATKKTSSTWAAFVHASVYSAPFWFIAGYKALLVIWVTHLLIDRFRLARYVVWAKNLMAPKTTLWCNYGHNDQARCGSCRLVRALPWSVCTATGYPPDRPAWLAVWLLIAADNTLHLAINFAAIHLFGGH